MRSRILASVVSFFALAVVGCSGGLGSYEGPFPTPSPGTTPTPGSSPTPTPSPGATGRVRFVHASPNAGNIDIIVDGTRILSNRPYKEASGYLTLLAGPRSVLVNQANTSTTLLNTNIVVNANADETVLAVGPAASVQPVVRPDNNAPPAAGNVRARLIHASSGINNVDVYLTAPNDDISTGPPTAANIAFRGTTTDVDFPAGTYRVRVTPVGNRTTVLVDSGPVTLSAGKVYTSVLVGDSSVGQAPELILLTDN
jgi:hypothetical protein